MKNILLTSEKENVVFNLICGKEYQLRIVDKDTDIPNDFFFTTYCEAFSEVEKIIEENETRGKNENIQETSNNIIAFCGERGQGKSSVMLSFSKMLGDYKNYSSFFENNYNNINKFKFHVLGRIDPTELEKQQSILSVIISRIFFDFKKMVSDSNKCKIEDKNRLLNLFQRCYKNIGIIKKTNNNIENSYYEDDLDSLSSLSDSTNIKKDFYELVEYFLNFKYEKGENSFLVIQVDDTDLNVSKAYEIVEDLRKYFMIPKVLILMATKPEQLTKAVEQEFKNSFKTLAESNTMKPEEFYHMASKYIMKLIPGSRRIDLPDIAFVESRVMDKKIGIKYFEAGVNIFDYSNSGCKVETIQDILLRFIFDKTGIIFVKKEKMMHPIIPQTARALANFVSILREMPNIKNIKNFNELDTEDTIRRLNNLNKFEEYFVNTWIEENVSYQFHYRIKEWLKTPLSMKNSKIINDLKGMAEPNKDVSSSIKNTKIFEEPFHENNIAGVLRKIKEIEYNYTGENFSKFIFAIKVLYTILIHKNVIQQILDESIEGNNYQIKYNTDIVDFIGRIYVKNINDFMPLENKKFGRASFTSFLKFNEFKNCFSEKNDRFILTLYLGDYLNHIDFNTSSLTSESVYYFDVSMPLVRLLQPFGVMDKAIEEYYTFNDGDDKNTFYIKNFKDRETIDFLRYFSFQIVSNVEVLENLQYDFSKSSFQSNNTSYLINFYQRINKLLIDLKYLPIYKEYPTYIKKFFEQLEPWINVIYENRKIYEDRAVHKHLDDRIIRWQNELYPYKLTNTYDKLIERLDKTSEIFTYLNGTGMISVFAEYKELSDLSKRIKKNETLSETTCLKYQTELNKLIRIVKEKLEAYLSRMKK